MTSNTELQWICEAPSHYNDYLFTALAKDMGQALEVNFMIGLVGSHPWKDKPVRSYKNRVFNKWLGVDWSLVRKSIGAKRSTVFLIGGWFDATAIVLIALCSPTNKRFMIWTDTPRERSHSGVVFGGLRRMWLKFVFRNATYILGTGDKAITVLGNMGCAQTKLINLPYFTSNTVFTPPVIGSTSVIESNASDIVFLSSGRLVSAVKGYDLAIRALALFRKTHPAVRFKYRIAGVGPDLESLKALVSEVGLDGYVEFAGWLEARELPEFYRSGSIFLHPARYEPYGVAVIEAMASGLAVIGSSDTGAIYDRIVHGQNGYVHRDGDVTQLSESIAQAVSDPANLSAIRKRARETAEQWPIERGVAIVKKALSACVE